jgi:hypothetical protein
MVTELINPVHDFLRNKRINIPIATTIADIFKFPQELVFMVRMCDGFKLMSAGFFLSLCHDSCNLGVKWFVLGYIVSFSDDIA